ncbi:MULTISPECIES: alpha/beta hydrolase [Catenuloplanes]|uniref:Acetyl esterase n=1 Tax=Catenuloplanes niger TaxID=587534 RepID=A0AAE3ZZ41_9ACTN|nr:alpha/beta hydrolase [Catenuloplanes niger]MDR7327617.1 acetyl esterase [Catenuloplanes niger]
MAKLDLRVRLLGRLLRRNSITGQSTEQILRNQRVRVGHNPLTDLLLGAVASGVTLADSHAAGETGPLRIRSYRPATHDGTPLPLIVNFHGGGWVVGSLDTADWLCSNVAAAVGAVVVSVDYRLAPTHRFPAAAEDCYAALTDVAGRAAEFGADPRRLAVMGDSAGGNLAAVTTLMARDRSGPAISFQALIYPATDLTGASPSIDENADAPILTRDDIVTYRDHYLGGADPTQPYASPLFAADHHGLPRALIQVAEHDPIRDDGLRYADVLHAAGVPVRTVAYAGMPHGFLAFPRLCRGAPRALADLTAALRSALTDPAHHVDK